MFHGIRHHLLISWQTNCISKLFGTENYNIRSVSKAPPVTVADHVNQHDHLNLSFYDPSDLQVNDVNTIQKTNVEDSVLIKIDSITVKP
jgi:hypothetical protein